jgi:hypothetical protein
MLRPSVILDLMILPLSTNDTLVQYFGSLYFSLPLLYTINISFSRVLNCQLQNARVYCPINARWILYERAMNARRMRRSFNYVLNFLFSQSTFTHKKICALQREYKCQSLYNILLTILCASNFVFPKDKIGLQSLISALSFSRRKT